MGLKEKQALYDMLVMRYMRDPKHARGASLTFEAILYRSHLYAMEVGNYILAPLGENLDEVKTILDA